jgi:hypothetical protein
MLAALLAMPAWAWAIPLDLSVSGQLLDGDGNPMIFRELRVPPGGGSAEMVPVHRALAARLIFFNDRAATQSLTIVDASADAYNGYFAIYYQLPGSTLAQDELWYDLAIDVDGDGVTAEDFFEDRFRIASVPFALSAQPTTFMIPFPKSPSSAHFFIDTEDDILYVAPFVTPSGGARISRFYTSIFGVPSGARCSFGVYDADGKLVVRSKIVDGDDPELGSPIRVVEAPVTLLAPSTLYYGGFIATGNPSNFAGGLMHTTAILPDLPLTGQVPGFDTKGVCPDEFDPAAIDPSKCWLPPLTFYHVEPHGNKSMQALSRMDRASGVK